MLYTKDMKRIILISLSLLFASLLFFSCEDIFHDANTVLEEIRDSKEIPDPKRIFIGGDFTYNWDGLDRQGLAVINGSGSPDIDTFFTTQDKGIQFGAVSEPGVKDIVLTDSYVYVGGNFESLHFHGDTDYSLIEYNHVHRYYTGGGLDLGYKPFDGAPNDLKINAIHVTNNNYLIAGGFFSSAWPSTQFGPALFDGAGVNYSMPGMIESTDEIYSLQPLFDNDTVLMGGMGFSDFDGVIDLNNFAAIILEDINTPTVVPSGTGGFPPTVPALSNTQIRDFAIYGKNLYVAGTETAMMTPRVYKYKFTDTEVTEDVNFNSNLENDFKSSPVYSIFQVYAIAAGLDGSIYIGGEFEWEDSNGFLHEHILKLLPDGSIDENFKVSLEDNYKYLPAVYDLAIQKNGKLLIAGSFDTVITNNDTAECRSIIRLSAYGTIDDFDRYALPEDCDVFTIAIEEEPE